MWNPKNIEKLVEYRLKKLSWLEISQKFSKLFNINVSPNNCRKAFYRKTRDDKESTPAKILVFDIETSPMEVYCWGLFDQNISLDMIIKDWSVLSFSAKWIGSDKVMYQDTSKKADVRDDKDLIKSIWLLLNEADCVLTQNGKRFDVKKLNSRFLTHGFPPPSSYQHIDTLVISKKHFAETSNKLEYLTKKFCKKFKKSGHKQFPGFSLWKECLAGNKKAWTEMQDYNKIDVLSLEELYLDYLRPWDKTVNFNIYHDSTDYFCSCGSTSFNKNGFVYTNTAKYQRYTCNICGAHHQDNQNLLSKEKRKSLRK